MKCTYDEAVDHVLSTMEEANCTGECDEHGEQELLKLGGEMVCRDCVSEFLYGALRDLEAKFPGSVET